MEASKIFFTDENNQIEDSKGARFSSPKMLRNKIEQIEGPSSEYRRKSFKKHNPKHHMTAQIEATKPLVSQILDEGSKASLNTYGK